MTKQTTNFHQLLKALHAMPFVFRHPIPFSISADDCPNSSSRRVLPLLSVLPLTSFCLGAAGSIKNKRPIYLASSSKQKAKLFFLCTRQKNPNQNVDTISPCASRLLKELPHSVRRHAFVPSLLRLGLLLLLLSSLDETRRRVSLRCRLRRS